MAQTKTDKTLAEYTADGRRKLNASFSGQKEMLACGWTQAEINALVTAPRAEADVKGPDAWVPIEGDKNGNVTMPEGAEWHWPKVDGFAVCGTSLLTDDEKARYRAYTKARENGSAPKQRTTKQPEDMDKWNALLEHVKDDPVAVQMVKDLMPKPKAPSAFKKLTGKDAVDDTVYTRYGLMYVGPNGERKDNLMADELPALLEEGWTPARLLKDVNDLIAKVKAEGIKVNESAVGTTFSL